MNDIAKRFFNQDIENSHRFAFNYDAQIMPEPSSSSLKMETKILLAVTLLSRQKRKRQSVSRRNVYDL